jgi:quercetin dioxygenase-like cupin family protein
MLERKTFNFGKVSGVIFDFPITNDILPLHTHDEGDTHMTIVARGSFMARGNGWRRTIMAGDVLDFQPSDAHEFVALEDNSRIVNIIKG